MGLVEHIHPVLAEIDYRNTQVKLVFISSSFAFFLIVFTLSHIFGSLTIKTCKLARRRKVLWNTDVVRVVYGIFCIAVGTWAIFVDEELERDVVFSTTPTSYFALTVTVGFCVFEYSIFLLSDIMYKRSPLLLHIHHVIMLVGYMVVLVVESSHFFATKALIVEMIAPFSAISSIVSRIGKRDSMFWKANQFLFVHAYHLRNVVEFLLWYLTFKHWDRIWTAMPLSTMIMQYTGLVLMTCFMTPYWAYHASKQMILQADRNCENCRTIVTNGEARIKAD